MHDTEELSTSFLNPILEPKPNELISLSSNHQTFNIVWEAVAMYRVEKIPVPDFG
jgi:hypothetical protein